MTTIQITQHERDVAVETFQVAIERGQTASGVEVDPEGEAITPSAANEIAADLPKHVAQVIACDSDGSRWPSDAWPEPCSLAEIADALDDAVAGRFELPTEEE